MSEREAKCGAVHHGPFINGGLCGEPSGHKGRHEARASYGWVSWPNPEATIRELRAENDRIWAEVVRWKTATEEALEERRGHLAEIERLQTLLRTMDHFADVAETCERKSNEYAAENEQLRAQVAAVRALADSWDVQSWADTAGGCADRLRAALSSSEPVSEEWVSLARYADMLRKGHAATPPTTEGDEP